MSKKNKNRITIGGNRPNRGQIAPNTIVVTQPKRFGIDISDLTTAIKAAENIDYTTRYKLYDLYTDIMLDTHLTSVIDKRIESVLSADIEFRREGKPDDAINEQIRSPWFTRCLADILDARFWGFTLLQFYKEDGWINYDLVPRKHVDPVRKEILKRQTDINGIPWEDYSDLLYIGDNNNLGMLAKAAPWVIYKRSNVADWAQFAEVFGMPIREYIYDSDDNEARQRAVEDAKNSGSLSTFIHAKDTELLLKEAGNKSGSSELYDKFCERCNAEISKLILGNTLTTEAGNKGTQALGTVHKKVEDKLIKSDRRFLLNVLNYDMTDIFMSMGIDTSNGLFCYPEPKEIDLTAKMSILASVKKNFNLPISDDYLYEELGIEKPKNYNELKKKNERQVKKEPKPSIPQKKKDEQDDNDLDNTDKNKKKFASWLKGFFVQASQDEAHLNW